MPAKDVFHYQARHALEKDGWVITHDQFFIQSGGVEIYIDLGAEHLIAAQKERQKIAIEVKSFVAPSIISEFHTAVGQYIDYRSVLEDEEPDRKIYLAVPSDIYESFFQLPFAQRVMTRNQIYVMVFDVTQEVIVQWHD
ncbi:XisH family protein [Desulfobacterales bacterium HSG16]|nr:XisH family protein [Desulfobacterales bacterium HSG16]